VPWIEKSCLDSRLTHNTGRDTEAPLAMSEKALRNLNKLEVDFGHIYIHTVIKEEFFMLRLTADRKAN